MFRENISKLKYTHYQICACTDNFTHIQYQSQTHKQFVIQITFREYISKLKAHIQSQYKSYRQFIIQITFRENIL